MEFLKNGTEHVTQGKTLNSTIEENSEIVDRNESTDWKKNLNPEKMIQNNQYRAVSQ